MLGKQKLQVKRHYEFRQVKNGISTFRSINKGFVDLFSADHISNDQLMLLATQKLLVFLTFSPKIGMSVL